MHRTWWPAGFPLRNWVIQADKAGRTGLTVEIRLIGKFRAESRWKVRERGV